MNRTVELVKVMIQPVYVVKNEVGQITAEVGPDKPIPVYAFEVDKLNELLTQIGEKVTVDVTTSKG